MTFGYDPESTYQDADIEMAHLQAQGDRISRLRKKGICLHGWRQDEPDGRQKCLECGVVASRAELDDARLTYL